ncbi:MAG: hypothetical protein AAGF11_21935 [Myxococcota bacterium]
MTDPGAMLYANGIDGATGRYDVAPITAEALVEQILNEPPADSKEDLRARKQRDEQQPEAIAQLEQELALARSMLEHTRAAVPLDEGRLAALTREIRTLERELARRRHFGVKEGVDATDIAQAGWGMILPTPANPAIVEALQELLDLRAAQAGPRFQLYRDYRGYHPGMQKAKFLRRNGADPSGPVDPDKVPYYLLIVASPEEIPYGFQYQLDVQYAVGRIWFPEIVQYAHYAKTVVDAETRGIRRSRTLSFFGVHNEDDPASELSARHLVAPLHRALSVNEAGWETRAFVEEAATRATLERLIGGEQTPALLFTASHGMGFVRDDPRQRAHQGALLCGDWPGPEQWEGEIPERFYLAGEHIGSTADVAGMMLFCFACHGAGTPLHDGFGRRGQGVAPRQLASAPFVSALPTSLLGRPNGALAFVGHIDRSWGCSFTTKGSRPRSNTTTFESALARLLDGQPVGHALDYFNARYAELSTELSEELQDEFREHDPYDLAALWTANNDARGYVVLGDPAARLHFGDGGRRGDRVTGAAVEQVRGSGAGRAEDGALPSVVKTAAEPATAAGGEADRQELEEVIARPPEISQDDRQELEEVIARPPEISQDDWAQIPISIQRYIDRLRARLGD